MKTVLCLSASRLCAEGAARLLERFSNGELRAVGCIPADVCSISQTADHLVVDLPASRGFHLVRAMCAVSPELKVIVLIDPALEDDVLGYARAGVAGYLTHDCTPSQMVAALLNGGPYVAQPIATVLLRRMAHSNELEAHDVGGARGLTPRETEVLKLIEKGLSNKEIARMLCVELTTVKNHVHQILSKMRARRRTEAIRMLHG